MALSAGHRAGRKRFVCTLGVALHARIVIRIDQLISGIHLGDGSDAGNQDPAVVNSMTGFTTMSLEGFCMSSVVEFDSRPLHFSIRRGELHDDRRRRNQTRWFLFRGAQSPGNDDGDDKQERQCCSLHYHSSPRASGISMVLTSISLMNETWQPSL